MSFSASGRTLWVGPQEQFKTLQQAVAASQPGDTIDIRAGIYVDDFAVIRHDLHIVGVGGKAHLHADRPIDNGKGILDIENGADVIIENLEFSGARVPDNNGAGIRHHGTDLMVRNCFFHDNQDGILAGSNDSARVTIDHSEFARNGAGDGRTHGVYVNHIASLTVTDSYFHDTFSGHHIKSRAAVTEIDHSRLDDGNANTSYSVDLPNGGNATLKDNIIMQGVYGDNKTLVNYGGEWGPLKPGHLLLEHNTLINERPGDAVGVYNRTPEVAELIGNTFCNVATPVLGPNHQPAPAIASGHGTAADGTAAVAGTLWAIAEGWSTHALSHAIETGLDFFVPAESMPDWLLW